MKICNTLQAHGCWIERYRSAYSSANNHLIAEALGIFVIGTAYDTFPEAPRWKEKGWSILCAEIRKQILEDGIGAERSLAYAQFSIELFEVGLWFAQRHALPVPEDYRQRLAMAKEALAWFKDRAGNYPRIGDDDNGAVIADVSLRHLFFSLQQMASPDGIRTFDQGGYSVARFKAQDQPIMLAFDHGDLGYLSIAAHGHADALALWLHIGDQPVLVDAGTYLYHGGGTWRDYFRSTSAHNTLAIQNNDSSTMAGPFNWSRKARTTLISTYNTPDEWNIAANHDGYVKTFGALHERRLQVTFESGCKITDSITGNDPLPVEIRFLFHPSLTAVENEEELHILKNENILLRIRHESPLATQINLPGSTRSGWYSDNFGKKQPTTQIVFHGILAPQQPAITHLLWKS